MFKKVIGVNQSKREINKNNVEYTYIAKDADLNITGNLIELCSDKNVKIKYVDTMKELGNKFNVNVNVAAASILKVEEVSKC